MEQEPEDAQFLRDKATAALVQTVRLIGEQAEELLRLADAIQVDGSSVALARVRADDWLERAVGLADVAARSEVLRQTAFPDGDPDEEAASRLLSLLRWFACTLLLFSRQPDEQALAVEVRVAAERVRDLSTVVASVTDQ